MSEQAESYLIVGLGNPGSAYRGTFHNAGREVAEEFAAKHRVNFQTVGECMIARFKDHFIMLPETYMNLTGNVVGPFARFKKISPDHLLAIVDDLYLPAGSVRIKARGSCAGHNGLRSIEEALGTSEYPRIRVGIGPDPGGAYRADYVLSHPRPQVEADLFEGKARAISAIDAVLFRGIDKAMEIINA